MAKKVLVSPLRYPGSKRRLASYVSDTLRQNDLRPGVYLEPFAGGASVALQLLADDRVDRVVLMDKDPLIAHFWEAVFWDTDWLVDQILEVEVTLENWHNFKDLEPKGGRQFAMKCLFLNRTSYSGIIRPEVGPLGGKDQKSDYPVDCRFPRKTLVRRIRQAAQMRDRVQAVWGCDWMDGMDRAFRMCTEMGIETERVFLYLDPPFFNKADKLYNFYFSEKDHLLLRDFLVETQAPWLLSYDAADGVQKLYGEPRTSESNGRSHHEVELLYSSSPIPGRQPRMEILITNLARLPSRKKLWSSQQEGSTKVSSRSERTANEEHR